MDNNRRRQVISQTGARKNLPDIAVEKDFWVCWTLQKLFSTNPFSDQLAFKGGTSLSKGWKLIDRFSEDIDIVIDRGILGYQGENAPEEAASRRQEKKRLEEIRISSRRYISEIVRPGLLASMSSDLPGRDGWSLEEDSSDTDGQTLVFLYPSALPEAVGYINRAVKIEMGARSDTEPLEQAIVTSYIAESFPDLFAKASFVVRAVGPIRTFWEKAMLLHEESYRPAGTRKRKQYLARHYYDLFRLITSGIGREAAADLDLFRKIVKHRSVYFRHTWMNYDTIAPGSLSLVPDDERLPQWREDYRSMSREMFYGDVPTFEEILEVVAGFQNEFNKGK
jgi:hypothetical protein